MSRRSSILLVYVLFAVFPKNAFSQRLTCPAHPEQLKANIEKQIHQNSLAIRAGWEVIKDDRDLVESIADSRVVRVPVEGEGYYVRKSSYSRLYLVPDAYKLLASFAHQFANEFPGRVLRVTALTRTDAQHRWLRRKNPNAASCKTELRCSSHRRGGTIDVSYRNLRSAERQWVRRQLEWKEARGEVIYIEEVCRANFHVFTVSLKLKGAAMQQAESRTVRTAGPPAEGGGGG